MFYRISGFSSKKPGKNLNLKYWLSGGFFKFLSNVRYLYFKRLLRTYRLFSVSSGAISFTVLHPSAVSLVAHSTVVPVGSYIINYLHYNSYNVTFNFTRAFRRAVNPLSARINIQKSKRPAEKKKHSVFPVLVRARSDVHGVYDKLQINNVIHKNI